MQRGRLLLVIFGCLDLYSFYRSFPQLVRVVESYSGGLIPLLTVLLITSLLVSGPMLMLGNKTGYVIYYFQFPFRLAFFVLTFGFVSRLVITQPGTFSQGMLQATLFALEAVRLMLTIQKNKVNI